MRIIKTFLTGIALFTFNALIAQNDINEKDKLLNELNDERIELDLSVTKKIQEIDTKINNLDIAIGNTQNTTTKVNRLLERVQELEKKQTAVEEKTFGVYKYNYSSAIVNLASMEREIKPLNLFNASKDFFGTLENVSNPMQYDKYAEWFKVFNNYIDKNKDKEASLNALNHILTLTGDLTKGTPFTGTVASSLFEGISLFIGSLKKKEKELNKQSIQMFKLTAAISQFSHDKNLIETEYSAINKSLDELKAIQDEAIFDNIVSILGIKKDDFDKGYTKETDAIKRFEYIKTLTALVESKIKAEKEKNPEEWKEVFHRQMKEIQSLKIRFGTITFRILENIQKYESLIKKYKTDEFLGDKVIVLESKLKTLQRSFESTFSPQEYIKAANIMYVVD